MSPEVRQAIRERLRIMGLTEEQIEERLREGWGGRRGGGPPAGAEPGNSGEPGKPPTPEEIEALRERLRERGLTEEQIEEAIARRRRPRQ